MTVECTISEKWTKWSKEFGHWCITMHQRAWDVAETTLSCAFSTITMIRLFLLYFYLCRIRYCQQLGNNVDSYSSFQCMSSLIWTVPLKVEFKALCQGANIVCNNDCSRVLFLTLFTCKVNGVEESIPSTPTVRVGVNSEKVGSPPVYCMLLSSAFPSERHSNGVH